ncbi:MAG: hypothetical protein AB1451_16820 [Nitrospirota bacterium]
MTVALVRAGHGDALPQVARFNQALEAGVRTIEDFNARFGVSDKARAVAERLREFESEHQVVKKTQDAVERGTERAKEALERLRKQ